MNTRVISAKINVMMENPFWGALGSRLELADFNEDTFATDGKKLYVPDEKYYADWSFEQIKGVIAHEIFHCAFGHVYRREYREPVRWNFACDYTANLVLVENGFVLPKGCLYDEKYRGMTPEKIYNLLPKDLNDCFKNSDGNGNQGDNPDNSGNSSKNSTGGLTQGDILKPAISEDETSKELEQNWKEAVASAYNQAQQMGQLPAGLKEFVDANLFPKVAWQEMLYRFLQSSKGNSDYVSYPFNRRHIYRDIFLPSLSGERIDIVCVIDTSGSCSNEDLRRYFSEIRGICSLFGEYTIHLFQADMEVNSYEVIEDDGDIPSFALGRGGTAFAPVFNKIEQEELFELPVIYFTDLCGSFPTNPITKNVFWLVRKNQIYNEPKVPFGQVVVIED